jgi:hypothetical protein
MTHSALILALATGVPQLTIEAIQDMPPTNSLRMSMEKVLQAHVAQQAKVQEASMLRKAMWPELNMGWHYDEKGNPILPGNEIALSQEVSRRANDLESSICELRVLENAVIERVAFQDNRRKERAYRPSKPNALERVVQANKQESRHMCRHY